MVHCSQTTVHCAQHAGYYRRIDHGGRLWGEKDNFPVLPRQIILMITQATQVLFGGKNLSTTKKYKTTTSSATTRPSDGSWANYVFGFLYEEDFDDQDILYRSQVEEPSFVWKSKLNISLFFALLLSSIADTVPVAIVTHLDTVPIASLTAASTLGSACGKFTLGPFVDICGARRTYCVFTTVVAVALAALACFGQRASIACCFCIEFAYAALWPSVMVVLATHARGDDHGLYEGGIYVTSLAVRLGSLVGIPVFTILLRTSSWYTISLIGAWLALIASSIMYLFVTDSPHQQDEPQNPIDPHLIQKWFPQTHHRPTLSNYVRLLPFIFQKNILPSLTHVLKSGVFWILALAHTGSCLLRSSERTLGRYFLETTDLSENRSSALAVFLSVGTVLGLIVAGSLFAGIAERPRKRLVVRLYASAILACYTLAGLSLPFFQRFFSTTLLASWQVLALVVAGFGTAVQMYHVPSLVGATFGCDKGLFASYLDGVAYGIAACVWRFIRPSLEEVSASSSSVGWAYGWSAVALLLLLSALLMVEFMEHYFCRSRYGGAYETILLA